MQHNNKGKLLPKTTNLSRFTVHYEILLSSHDIYTYRVLYFAHADEIRIEKSELGNYLCINISIDVIFLCKIKKRGEIWVMNCTLFT